MAKKPVENKAEPVNKNVCQYCKNHKNNPSFCRLTKQYVGRKGTCDKIAVK